MKKLLIIFLIIFLTGCWNYRELNNCAIASGLAIDYTKDGYKISLLFSNSKKENDSTSILSAEGKTIYEAIKRINLSTPKEIYISHLSFVIVSEEVAKEGVAPVLDYLLREPESNQNFNLIISKGHEAKEILSITSELSDYPSQNINSTIKVSEKEQARIINSDFNYFVSSLLSQGINPIANSITVTDNKKNTQLDTLAIFKNDKLIDWATTEESIGINMLRGNVKNLYTTVNVDNSNIVVTCTKYKIKKKYKNNKIVNEIYCEGMINEVEKNLDINNKKILKRIEYEVKKKLTKYIEDAIKVAKDNNTDIFGYGNYLHKYHSNLFKKIDNLDQFFTNLNIESNIKIKLINKGALLESIGD